jgi:hypothetical protein
MSLDNSNTNAVMQLQNFIGGEFLESDCYLESYDPSNDELWARIPDSTSDEVNIAVKAAKVAFKSQVYWVCKYPLHMHMQIWDLMIVS